MSVELRPSFNPFGSMCSAVDIGMDLVDHTSDPEVDGHTKLSLCISQPFTLSAQKDRRGHGVELHRTSDGSPRIHRRS